VFPVGFSEVFASRSRDQIRIWNVTDQKELLRICLSDNIGSKATCNCIQFTSDGRNIVSGWSDGVVRFFTPQSGRLLYLIKDAHKKTSDVVTQVSGVVARPKFYWADGVTSISASQDCKTLITGGSDCDVKMWQIGKQTNLCLISQRVHKAAITSIKHLERDSKAASSSIDG
jgi:cilia- and flagella-associated protein 52